MNDASAEKAKLKKKLKNALVFTVLSILLALAFTVFVLIPSIKQSARTPLDAEKRRMTKICIALLMYAARNGGVFPEKLSQIYTNDYLGDFEYFDSPFVDSFPSSAEEIDAGKDYVYLANSAKIADEYIPVLKLNTEQADFRALVSKKDIKFIISGFERSN